MVARFPHPSRLVPALALAAILLATAALSSPRETGGPMSQEGFRTTLLLFLGCWGWVGISLARLDGASRASLWGFRIGGAACLAVCLARGFAPSSECAACFAWPAPEDYRAAGFHLLLLWLVVVALENIKRTSDPSRWRPFGRFLRAASLGWLGLSLLLLSAAAFRLVSGLR